MTAGYRVLVVEDVMEMRVLLGEILVKISAIQHIDLAQNTWEARYTLEKHRPDWVLLDEVLPGESSVDFLKFLKKQGFRVVLLTGMESDESRPLPPEAIARVQKPESRELEGFIEELRGILKG